MSDARRTDPRTPLEGARPDDALPPAGPDGTGRSDETHGTASTAAGARHVAEPHWVTESGLPEDTLPYAPARRGVVAPPTQGRHAEPEGTQATSGPALGPPLPTHPHPAPGHRRTRRWPRRVALGTAALLVVALAAATVHLYRTSTAWEERAEEYLIDARGLGGELATTRAELDGTQAELAAVREQLAAAHGRIVELADEKARLGDDRELQRQMIDYQERVSAAAGQVAHALDQCAQAQQQLIGYLQQTVEGSAQYAPEDLARFTSDVETLCQAASEANMSLQRELSR